MTVTLSYDDVSQMTPEQRVLFKDIFTNIERILFVDNKGETLTSAFFPNIVRYAKELGVKKPPPLLSLCSFYAVKNQLDLSNTPDEVREQMQYPMDNFFDTYTF